MNDPAGGPRPEYWVRPFGGAPTEPVTVVVGTADPVQLSDAALHDLLQVPLGDVIEASAEHRPGLVALVATADELAASQLLPVLGARLAGVPVTVLAPGAASPTELARLVAPAPVDLVALPAEDDGNDATIGLASLRQQLRDQLGDGVPELRRQDAELCLTELVANAARHGAGEPSATFGWSLGRLRVSVQDQSTRWPSPEIPHEGGGRGIRLVHTLADAWGVTPAPDGDGKVVWFELEAVPRP